MLGFSLQKKAGFILHTSKHTGGKLLNKKQKFNCKGIISVEINPVYALNGSSISSHSRIQVFK
jgi:hypothetical protein